MKALAGILLLFLIAGCASQPSPQNASNVSNTSFNTAQNATCSDEGCFIAAANNCQNMSLTLTNDIGTFSYSSNENCVFTKTLVQLNSNESQQMQSLLNGKSMSCIYGKGNFDSRLVTTLIGGMEYCSGELKDDLGRLMIFS
jgi:hypothetical protein